MLFEILDTYDQDVGSGIARPSDDQGHRPPPEEMATLVDHHLVDCWILHH